MSLFCSGTGPSFPQESWCPGVDISSVPQFSLLEIAIAASTCPGTGEGPTGLRQERSWPVVWEMIGYLIRSHLQLFITLTNYLITWADFFLT